MRDTCLLLVFLFLAACGTAPADVPDAGPAEVVGSLHGTPYHALDAVFVEANVSGLDFNGTSTAVQISDFGAACAKQTTSTGVPNGRPLFLGLALVDGGGAATPARQTGAYTVATFPLPTNAKVAEVFYEEDGADCRKSFNEQATTGTVTVTRSDATGFAGTFDLTFPTAGHVTGRFDAAQCAALNPNRTPLNGCP